MSDVIVEDANAEVVVATGAGVAVTETIDAEVVEELEPIQVTGALQFVIPTPNETMHLMHKSLVGMQQRLDTHTDHLKAIRNRVMHDIDSIDSQELLHDIQKMLKKKMVNKATVDPKYAKTKEAASYINVDPSFLTKGQGRTFKEGIHYLRPEGSTILRWNLEMLEEWLHTVKREEDHNAIIDKMFS